VKNTNQLSQIFINMLLIYSATSWPPV